MQLNFGWHILVISHHSCTRIDMLSAPLFATSAPIKHRLYTYHIRGDNRIIIGYVSQFILEFSVVKAKQVEWNVRRGLMRQLAVLNVRNAPKERTVQPRH